MKCDGEDGENDMYSPEQRVILTYAQKKKICTLFSLRHKLLLRINAELSKSLY